MASFTQVLKTFMLFLIPAYLTMAAVSTPSQEDDQSWLRYWVVISLFSLMELPLDNLDFLPGYNITKLVFGMWCLLPGPLSGSNVIFQMIHPLFEKCHYQINTHMQDLYSNMAYRIFSYIFQYFKIGGESFPNIFQFIEKASSMKDYLPNISNLFGQSNEAKTDIFG
eukprot:GFUD01071762.1.p1 GENE.GFUD01071762.1~~GFUD01071762.1.p1  ORF type:complete len:167 (-),score=29.82 GFUD01071762.1:25-525(-)